MKLKELNQLRASIPREVWRLYERGVNGDILYAGEYTETIQRIVQAEEGRKVMGNCGTCGRIIWLRPTHDAVYRDIKTGKLEVGYDVTCLDCYEEPGVDW